MGMLVNTPAIEPSVMPSTSFPGQAPPDPAVIEPLWQGPEDQAPVNRCIPIDLPDHIQQFLLRNIFRQMELPHLHANLTAPGDDPFS